MRHADQRPAGRRRGWHLVLPVLVLVGVVNSALSQRYEARLVASPQGYAILEVSDLNNRGEMVGTAHRISGPWVAIKWRADGSVVQLPQRPDIHGRVEPTSNAYGINDRGEIVGRAATRGPSVAVMWPNENQVVRLLRGSSVAVDINNSGAVIGYRETALFRFEGFVWGHAGWSAMLPLLQMQYADAMNDRGQVVGESVARVPMLWENNVFTEIGRAHV